MRPAPRNVRESPEKLFQFVTGEQLPNLWNHGAHKAANEHQVDEV